MKILEINTTDKKGGAANVAYSLKTMLEKKGHTVSFFVKQKHSNDNNVFTIKQNCKIFNIFSFLSKKIIRKDIPNYLKNKIRSLLKNDIDFFGSNYLLKTKEFRDADLIHCHNLHGNYFNLKILQKLSRIKPVVWTLHDMWAITSHYVWLSDVTIKKQFDSLVTSTYLDWDNSKYLLDSKKKIYENSKLNIVVPSLWLKKIVEKSMLKSQNLTLIYNGIDNTIFKKYDKTRTRQYLKLPTNKKIITFLANGGKNNNQKGWEYAQYVANFYKNNMNILFLCIGGNKTDEQVNNNNIRYVEYIDNQELLAQYYSVSDIFLFTSLFENFPLTILEAMACGTPIVSFDVGGVKEVLTHKKNGYIAEYKNKNSLIKGVEYILKLNLDKLNKMSQNSIQKINNEFTLEIMTENYLKLYRKLLNDDI